MLKIILNLSHSSVPSSLRPVKKVTYQSIKLGGLDVESDRDRERPSRRDQFLKLVKIFSTVETDFFLASRSRQKSRNLDF